MDSRPVFVLSTAKTCPACQRFKENTWSELKTELEKTGKVQVVTVELETTNSKPSTTKYHPDLKRFIGWFPTMALFPADKWNNHKTALIGIVKNGKLVRPTETTPERVEIVGKINLSKDDILKWVDYTLSNDKFFNKGGVKASAQPAEKIKVPTVGSFSKFKPSRAK